MSRPGGLWEGNAEARLSYRVRVDTLARRCIPLLKLYGFALRLHVEVQCRCHDLDVLCDCLWKMILLVARDMGARRIVFELVDVVLRPEQVFCLLHRNVGLQPTPTYAEVHAFGLEAADIHEPRADGLDRLCSRAERLCNTAGCPVLAIVGRGRMRDIEKVRFDVLEIRLGEPDAQGQDQVRFCAADSIPSTGDVASRFMHDTRRGGRGYARHSKDKSQQCEASGQSSGGQHPVRIWGAGSRA